MTIVAVNLSRRLPSFHEMRLVGHQMRVTVQTVKPSGRHRRHDRVSGGRERAPAAWSAGCMAGPGLFRALGRFSFGAHRAWFARRFRWRCAACRRGPSAVWRPPRLGSARDFHHPSVEHFWHIEPNGLEALVDQGVGAIQQPGIDMRRFHRLGLSFDVLVLEHGFFGHSCKPKPMLTQHGG